MAADPLDALRLTLMQDLLPVGLAVVDRARKAKERAEAVLAKEADADAQAALTRAETRLAVAAAS